MSLIKKQCKTPYAGYLPVVTSVVLAYARNHGYNASVETGVMNSTQIFITKQVDSGVDTEGIYFCNPYLHPQRWMYVIFQTLQAHNDVVNVCQLLGEVSE